MQDNLSDSHEDQSALALNASAQATIIPLEQQQALHLQQTFMEGADGYVDVEADEAEPMVVTRGTGLFCRYVSTLGCSDKKRAFWLCRCFTCHTDDQYYNQP
jgi:hypothetical protein